MERVWNYFLYSTWRLLVFLGNILIRDPISFIMVNVFPFLRKRENEALSSYHKVVNSKDFGFNISFAYGHMFFTTMLIYTTIFLYLFFLLPVKVEVKDVLDYFFILIVLLSYFTNQVLSWNNDKYLKYFKEFEKINNSTKVYIHAILFHVGVIIIAGLSVYWLIGF